MLGTLRTEQGNHVCELDITSTSETAEDAWQTFQGLAETVDAKALLSGGQLNLLLKGREYRAILDTLPPAPSTPTGSLRLSGRFGPLSDVVKQVRWQCGRCDWLADGRVTAELSEHSPACRFYRTGQDPNPEELTPHEGL